MTSKDCSIMNKRLEFVLLSDHSGANVSQLTQRFGIFHTTAYKRINRYHSKGYSGLADKSHRPQHSPTLI